jgi:D-alanine-D-alanine ligase
VTDISGRPMVLVLAGGPDAERDVSLASGAAVAEALARSSCFGVHHEIIEEPGLPELQRLPGDVIFPVLHGPWGEGGPLQDLLVRDGRPFVGCRAEAARLAMDKDATKAVAQRIGLPTAEWRHVRAVDEAVGFPLPAIVKPVDDGSSVGVTRCDDVDSLRCACASLVKTRGQAIVERYIEGRELTVGILGEAALPVVEIRPAVEMYSYEAKYVRDDTKYIVRPELPSGMAEELSSMSERLFKAIGALHLARVDWLLDRADQPFLLEVNTLPGFTGHSLVPMAAAETGLDMTALCERLVQMAIDAGQRACASDDDRPREAATQ